MRAFVSYHYADPALASNLLPFIWHRVVDTKLWSIAARYVADHRTIYDRALDKFEQATKRSDENSRLDGELLAQIRGWCVEDLRDLWLVLRNCGRAKDATGLQLAALKDPRLRRHPSVAQQAFRPEPSPRATDEDH